jgi:hypothetical protein
MQTLQINLKDTTQGCGLSVMAHEVIPDLAILATRLATLKGKARVAPMRQRKLAHRP